MGVIYSITSPSGKVYIGQTVRPSVRFSSYRTLKCKGQRLLYRSFLKYGFDSHEIKIIHELPKDSGFDTMNQYEMLYISFYKDAGIEMLNLTNGGRNASPCTETRKLISDFNKGKPKSDAQKEKMRIAQIGKKMKRESVLKMIARRIELGSYRVPTKKVKRSKEEVAKGISEKLKEYWATNPKAVEHKQKARASMDKNRRRK